MRLVCAFYYADFEDNHIQFVSLRQNLENFYR